MCKHKLMTQETFLFYPMLHLKHNDKYITRTIQSLHSGMFIASSTWNLFGELKGFVISCSSSEETISPVNVDDTSLPATLSNQPTPLTVKSQNQIRSLFRLKHVTSISLY